ncbi:MAG: hypothetical protein HN350_11050 [Phycisphaerales bacterium]|nr:hypothetical protein [Phycisphaerales bacterium]
MVRIRFYAMAVLSILIVSLCASPVLGDVSVKITLSTGAAFEGTLLKDDGRRLVLKGDKRIPPVTVANIVDCTLTLTDENLPEDLAGVPGSRLGVFMMSKGHRFLAEVSYLCVLTKTARIDAKDAINLPLWAMEQVPWEKIVASAAADPIKAHYKKMRQVLPVRLGGRKLSSWRPRRYQLPSPRVIKSAVARRDEWARAMHKIAPKTHVIETSHFMIYSAWAKSDDTKLKGIYEKLYAALCKQFDIPATENIWIGKLPVYAFWERKHFERFAVSVTRAPPAMARGAGGFAGTRGAFQFVCLGPVIRNGMSKTNARTWFYELLVHETTHAFLARYINSHHIASWLNEGIAELLSATFVPKGGTSHKLKSAHVVVKKKGAAPFRIMFRSGNIPLDSVYYGAAQSLARYLVSRGKTKFIQLVYEFKNGTPSQEALKKVYGMTHDQLLLRWSKTVR